MFTELGKKESEANDKLIRAMEKCESLQSDVDKLREELSEYHFYEYDLWSVEKLFCFLLVLDLLEEELFKSRERNIEISIEKDHLYDSVSELEKQLYGSRKKFRKLQKQYDILKKAHSNCKNTILYR